jgi:putative transposase
MDERMRFVIRLKDGESMASLCREFNISRKTGYKIFEGYEECGLEGMSDRTRRPFRYANQLPETGGSRDSGSQAREAELGCTQDSRALVAAVAPCGEGSRLQHYPRRSGSSWAGHADEPVKTTDRGPPLSDGVNPNDLCTDYKGEFMLADKRYCYPLTVTYNYRHRQTPPRDAPSSRTYPGCRPSTWRLLGNS